MKTVIYCRVSTEDQKTLNQKIRLEEYCKRMGWEFDTYEETESSRNTRPIKQQVLEKLRKKEYERLLIFKFDRWARSTIELLMEFEELIKKDIKIVSFSENVDFSTSIGKLQFSILSAFAQFERDLIRERVMEGLNRAKKEGKSLGRKQGSKDSKQRKKGGYYLRHMKTTKIN